MPKYAFQTALVLFLLCAAPAVAADVEEMKGAAARDRVGATAGLVLVDLYAEW